MITKEKLEEKQIGIYILTIILSILVGLKWNNSQLLEKSIELIIGILLCSVFCHILTVLQPLSLLNSLMFLKQNMNWCPV